MPNPTGTMHGTMGGEQHTSISPNASIPVVSGGDEIKDKPKTAKAMSPRNGAMSNRRFTLGKMPNGHELSVNFKGDNLTIDPD